MPFPRRRPLLLAHLFATPLVKETADVCGEEHEPEMTPIKQHNYARERDVITRCVNFRVDHGHARCLDQASILRERTAVQALFVQAA